MRGHRAAVAGVGVGHSEAAAVGRRVRVQGCEGGQEREREGVAARRHSLSLSVSHCVRRSDQDDSLTCC